MTQPAASQDGLCCPHCRTPLLRRCSAAAAGLEPITAAFHCPACQLTWPQREGIPSFLSTDFYWGEIPRPEMQAILHDIATKGWHQVVYRDLPRRYPDRYRYIFHPIRADWLYLGKGQERGAALDLGAGWGGLSLRLSRLFERVVAVEGVWERIKFASLLFRQEDASNVIPLHADIHSLPLAEESFDLVVMNGVLEWAALGGEESDPERAQLNLLAKARRMLRPGGTLYIGIENRFALIFLIGGRDHGQPRGMGVLPRPLAKWYGRLRRLSQRHPLTHSPAGYRRLLQQAGFDDIGFYCAFPSYSYPRVLIPLSHSGPRGTTAAAADVMLAWAAKRSSDWRADSMSLPARLAHRLAAHPKVARLACPRTESLAIWARRPFGRLRVAPAEIAWDTSRGAAQQPAQPSSAAEGRPLASRRDARLPEGGGTDCESASGSLSEQVMALINRKWDELGLGPGTASPQPGMPEARDHPPSGRELAVLQLSGNWEACGKVTWFVFADHSPQPAVVAKVSRIPDRGERLASEYNALRSLHSLSPEIARHAPRALAMETVSGHLVSLQEYVPGRAISRLARARPPEAAMAAIVGTCAPFLVQLACETRLGLRLGSRHPFLCPLLERAAFVTRSSDCSAEARDLLGDLVSLARQAEGVDLPIVTQHGDLNSFDILTPMRAGGRVRRARGVRQPTDTPAPTCDFRVTDWEWSTPAGLPFLDLVTLCIVAAEPAARKRPDAIEAATRALVGSPPLPHQPAYSRLRATAAEYCQTMGLERDVLPALAAAALLHSFVKAREASYAGARYITLADAGPWVTAGHALLAIVGRLGTSAAPAPDAPAHPEQRGLRPGAAAVPGTGHGHG